MTDEEAQFDKYGNDVNGDHIEFCCFPDCGCDGERLCMAKHGASERALRGNVEGMYMRKDRKAVRARMELLGMVIDDQKAEASAAIKPGVG